MFIQIETTPNPNAVKFYPNQLVNEGEPLNYFSLEEARNSPFAREIFQIEGVKGVFIGKDFITITKSNEQDWESLKPQAVIIIQNYLETNQPIVNYNANTKDQHTDLSQIEKEILNIIDTRVRPSVALDGGDIIYKGFNKGIVSLELHGSCSGCPSSTITLKNGIETMLKHYIPEVEAVEAVNG